MNIKSLHFQAYTILISGRGKAKGVNRKIFLKKKRDPIYNEPLFFQTKWVKIKGKGKLAANALEISRSIFCG